MCLCFVLEVLDGTYICTQGKQLLQEEMEEDSCLEKRESNGHIALEITPLEPPKGQESPMTSYLREELEGVSFPRCIFRVPSKFRSQKEDAYEPTLVSIGPMHHGKGNLQDMEDHKWKYLHSLLNRNLTLDTTLESCIQALKVLEPKIRACYDEDLSHIPSDKFLTMILLDGAFIIELFLRRYVRGLRTRDDTLFKSQETSHRLANDLILLENQIPFFVLCRIFSLIPLPKQLDKTISELSLKFFKNMILRDIHILHEKYSFDGSNHLLDLIWKCYLPTVHKYPLSSDKNLGRDMKSASKVQESGIKMKSADAESILDVTFVEGKLLVPSLRIHDHKHMETVLRNLIALEDCYGETMKYVTSYAYLMRGLLHSENDVRLFYRQRILLDYVKDKKDVVNLFKNLCEKVDLGTFYYARMWEEVSEYKRTMWEACWCKLKRKSRPMVRGNEMCKPTLVLLVVLFMLFGALAVIVYLFFRRESHES